MSLLREPFEAKKKLVASGMDEKQAEALIEMLAVAEYRAASRDDLKDSEGKIRNDLKETKGDILKEFSRALEMQTAQFDKKLMAMTISIVVILSTISGLINWLG